MVPFRKRYHGPSGTKTQPRFWGYWSPDDCFTPRSRLDLMGTIEDKIRLSISHIMAILEIGFPVNLKSRIPYRAQRKGLEGTLATEILPPAIPNQPILNNRTPPPMQQMLKNKYPESLGRLPPFGGHRMVRVQRRKHGYFMGV